MVKNKTNKFLIIINWLTLLKVELVFTGIVLAGTGGGGSNLGWTFGTVGCTFVGVPEDGTISFFIAFMPPFCSIKS